MSCVIKYKGQSIPEEQFLQYLNKQIAINNLFNENETFANKVYETLGFTGNISDEQKQQKEADIERRRQEKIYSYKKLNSLLKNNIEKLIDEHVDVAVKENNRGIKIFIKNNSGKNIFTVTFDKINSNTYEPGILETNENYRRKGIASKVYETINNYLNINEKGSIKSKETNFVTIKDGVNIKNAGSMWDGMVKKGIAKKEGDSYEMLSTINAKDDAELRNKREVDIKIGKVGNTEYEVKVDGVYFEGKKLDNPKNLSHKELITEHIRRRNKEELNRVDKQNGERLDSKDAELRNKREAATRVLNGKDSKSYLESEQAQQDYDILGGNIYEGIVSEHLDSDYIKRAYTPYSEEINAKYDAELQALESTQPTDVSTQTQTTNTEIVKEGVIELFESNPKLANSVYETLGFNNVIASNDKIVWGHPAIGKTTMLESNPDAFMDWDNEFNRKRDSWIANKSNTVIGTPEFKKARNEYMINYNNHKDYIAFVTEEWNKAKEKANKENKTLIASPHMLLNLFPSDFDKVITMNDKTFMDRAIRRSGGDEVNSKLWKEGINETLKSVDKSKIIETDKHINDLFITSEQKQQAQQMYSQYLEQNPNGTIEGFKEFVQGKQFQKLTAEEKAKTIEQVTKEHRSIAALKDLSAKLAWRIGGEIKFENRTDVDWKGYNQGMTSVLNEAYMTPDTPFHEILAHPIIRAIKKQDWGDKYNNDPFMEMIEKDLSGFSKLYNNLLKELETGRGKEVFEQVKRDYTFKKDVPYMSTIDKDVTLYYDKNTKTGYIHDNNNPSKRKTFNSEQEVRDYLNLNDKYILEEQQEEAIVTLLGELAAGKLEEKENATLKKKLLEFWKQISDFVKQLLLQDEIRIDELPITTTLNDLAEIMAYGNNKIILPGYKVEYSTPLGNKYETLEEVNNEIRGLADANVEVNLSGVKINYKKIIDSNELPKQFSVLINDEPYSYSYENNQWNLYYHIGGKQLEKSDVKIDKVIRDYNSYNLNSNINSFLEKNKEYEQSREIIEQWKKENNIQYDPEEVSSRGQGFYSSIGAYSNLELDLLLKNLIQHIEDNKKAGGEFTISAFTKPIDKRLKHIEGTGDRVRFVIYPKSNHIKWAAPTDVFSGSVWDAHEKVSKDKKSELLGVSFTKSPALRNVNEVSPNLADIIDNLSHTHNELGIELTTDNFRIEYDDNIDYSTKKLIDNINKILDDKYGKLEKPDIKKAERKQVGYSLIIDFNDGEIAIIEDFKTEEEANNALIEKRKGETREDLEQGYELKVIPKLEQGKQPTQTKENTTSIGSVRDRIAYDKRYTNHPEFKLDDVIYKHTGKGFEKTFYDEMYKYGEDRTIDITEDEYREAEKKYRKQNNIPDEYNQQALTNLKVAALKEVARKYPRSLITSRVVPINPNLVDNSEIQYSKVGSKQDIEGFKNFVQGKPNSVKPGVEELFKSNPKLANSVYETLGFTGNISLEQKQQAQQLYSQYLDTLTDEPVVYKGFRNKAGIVHNTPNHSYFTNSFKIANAWYKNEEGIKTFVIPKVRTEFFKADTSKGVSTIKPQEENFINSSKAGLIKLETNDIGGWQIQHVVNKSINMLELGSKQDIDGFSKFVSNDFEALGQRRKETINPPKEIGIIKTLKANLSFADRQKCN